MIGVLGKLSMPDPRRRHRRDDLFAGRHAPRRRRPQRGRRADPKGAEVMVTRYEKGIAYVRPWEEPIGGDRS